MVVAPRLLPKRNGVLHLFADCQRARLSSTNSQSPQLPASPSKDLADSVPSLLPTAADMLRTSALLFANTTPSPLVRLLPHGSQYAPPTTTTTTTDKDEDRDTDVMGTTSHGLVVFLTGDARLSGPTTDASQTDKWYVNVVISPGWMCLFGHETRFELYDPLRSGWDFGRMWREVRVQGPKLRQLVKWRGRVMLSSLVVRGSDDEKTAEREGWILLG